MPTAENPQETLATAEKQAPAKAPVAPSENGFVTRDAWLAQAGKLREKTLDVPDFGKVLIVELNGVVRARIQAQQSTGLLSDQKRVDVPAYQRELLLNGVADPSSPEGARRPLFTAGDVDRVMQIGGGKIALIVGEIETLSGLDAGATNVERAEGEADGTPSDAGTS